MMQDLANSILKYYSWCDDVETELRSGNHYDVMEGYMVKGQEIVGTTVIRDLLGYAHWLSSATDED